MNVATLSTPFFKLIRLTLKHRDYEKLKDGAMWLYSVLSQNLKMPVLGPEEPAISRIRNEYIRTIIVKIPQNTSLGYSKGVIQKAMNSFNSIPAYKAVKVVANVDPY